MLPSNCNWLYLSVSPPTASATSKPPKPVTPEVSQLIFCFHTTSLPYFSGQGLKNTVNYESDLEHLLYQNPPETFSGLKNWLQLLPLTWACEIAVGLAPHPTCESLLRFHSNVPSSEVPWVCLPFSHSLTPDLLHFTSQHLALPDASLKYGLVCLLTVWGWIFLLPPSLYVEALIPNVMVFGGGYLKIIRFRWGLPWWLRW